MTEDTWRPLGVDTDDDTADYDALHDGVPPWMETAYWRWVRRALTVQVDDYTLSEPLDMMDTDLAEGMAQTLRYPFPDLTAEFAHGAMADHQFKEGMGAIRTAAQRIPKLRFADYLLAQGDSPSAAALDRLLERSKSAWTVGERAGRSGLVRRVPQGVQIAADATMANAARAGATLARAWGELYGLDPNPSEAYRLAIKSVEDAVIPVVSPRNESASLGTVIAQMNDQKGWRLPMGREHSRAPSGDVVVSLMRMIWHGQHDRHGGQPSAPGDVSFDEAKVAVSAAVTLVNLFHEGLVARSSNSPAVD